MTQTAKLTASDGAQINSFGGAVAMSGDTIAVGAVFNDGGKGAVYVFEKPGAVWADMTQTAKLTASDGLFNDLLGSAVAVDADTIVATARQDDVAMDKDNRGSAYVFVRPAGGWADMTQTAKLTASDGANLDEFGRSVGVSGVTAVVGAVSGDHTYIDQGSAYVFELTPKSLLAAVLADIQALVPEPGITQDILDLSAQKFIDAIALIDAGEINQARNVLNAARYQGLAILDITKDNPAGTVNPCFLVAIDVIDQVLGLLPVPALSEQKLLGDLIVLLSAIDLATANEPKITQGQVNATIKKLDQVVVKLDAGKTRPARNQLGAFVNQATVIVDHSLNPAGYTNPCMLVAIDVAGVVQAMLGD